jgi:CRISPR-associated protein (Cas_Cas02710)
MKQGNPIVEWVTDPTKNFLTSFLVGTLLFTIVSDGISALFWENLGAWLQARLGIENLSTLRFLVVVVLMLAILVLIYVTPFSRWLKRRLVRAFGLNAPQTVQTHAKPLGETFPGLIAVMSNKSPQEESPAERAILHHWNGGCDPHVQHCWLVCTQQSQNAAKELEKKLIDRGVSQEFELYYGEDYKMDDLKNPGQKLSLCIPDDAIDDPIYIQRLIDCIYADARTRYGLEESEVIADFTGGTKTMSAGIILAGAIAARRLQYISQRGDRALMEIDIAYKLVPDKKG